MAWILFLQISMLMTYAAVLALAVVNASKGKK